jgi:hypothetical protein
LHPQLQHRTRGAIRVHCAAHFEEVVGDARAPEHDDLLAQGLEVDDVAIAVVQGAEPNPCALLRDVEQVPDDRQRFRTRRKRQATTTPLEGEQYKDASNGAHDVRREGTELSHVEGG